MHVTQWHLKHPNDLLPEGRPAALPRAVLVFGSIEALEWPGAIERLHAAFPGAQLLGCSTAGEITAHGVSDLTMTVTALEFERTRMRAARAPVTRMGDSYAAGRALAEALAAPDLKHVLVLSDGVHVNGSALVQGMVAGLDAGVLVSGGLAGDSGRFTRTLVLDGSGLSERSVAALGFYGSHLRAGHGSVGGWEAFGPIKRVTRSADNIVFTLDDKPALAMYDAYLGKEAAQLPASGLLFPLALVSEDEHETGVIRTLLAVDREVGSLTFAGDVPQGGLVRLMHANFGRLVEASGAAAAQALQEVEPHGDRLAILISCVGRRLLMGARIDEEVDAAREQLGAGCFVTGFYSNGEISPCVSDARCELQNQTMTITTLTELV